MQTKTEAATPVSQSVSVTELAKQGDAAASIGLGMWVQVNETDPNATKAFNKAGFQGTAISPIYLVQKATKIFGPMGIGWGCELLNESYVDGKPLVVDGTVVGKEVIHKVFVELWYLKNGVRGSVKQFGATTFVARDAYGTITTDEDHAKKSMTDAMSKCLSLLGFSADVHLGLFDDNKYVTGLKAKFDQAQTSDAEGGPTSPAPADGSNPPVSQQQSQASPSGHSARYDLYKGRLTEIESKSLAVENVTGVRAQIENDAGLTKMEAQTLLQHPLLRIAKTVHAEEQDAFL